MAIRTIAALVRSLREGRPSAPDVHFHQGPAGTPAPCFEPACENPRLPLA